MLHVLHGVSFLYLFLSLFISFCLSLFFGAESVLILPFGEQWNIDEQHTFHLLLALTPYYVFGLRGLNPLSHILCIM
jgi:hypothetical protein